MFKEPTQWEIIWSPTTIDFSEDLQLCVIESLDKYLTRTQERRLV